MFRNAKRPKDRRKHPRSAASQPLDAAATPGRYAYVVDKNEVIHVVPDGPHVHPTILGNGEEALYAGDLEIDRGAVVANVTNSSGTFQFKKSSVLCCVVGVLRSLGFTVPDDAAVWSPPDGSCRPQVIRC